MFNKMKVLLPLLFFSVLISGCATKGYVHNQVNPVQAQIGVLTEELVRLDDSVQDVRSAVQSGESRVTQLESQVGSSGKSTTGSGVTLGVYRTPSGFEVPSLNIQKALKNAGYYQGRLDGKIGPESEKAIRAFQRDNGLEADGVVGRKTWDKLNLYLTAIK